MSNVISIVDKVKKNRLIKSTGQAKILDISKRIYTESFAIRCMDCGKEYQSRLPPSVNPYILECPWCESMKSMPMDRWHNTEGEPILWEPIP